MEFSLFPPLEALQAAECQIARQRRLDSPPNPVFFECVSMFLQWFPSNYTFVAIKPVENIMFDNASNSLISPTVENTAIYSVFFNFSMFQCRSQLQYIYKKSLQNIVFDSVFPIQTDGNLHVFCHKGSKSFQNIAFDSVFVMLPVKQTVIYTFFAITSVQNTCFCSVLNALASKNPAKSCYVPCFFHFWPFFHCRKATKMTQNSISIPSCAQTP